MHKLLFLLTFMLLILHACNNGKEKVQVKNDEPITEAEVLPAGAIFNYYNVDSIKLNYFDAVLNDTDSIMVIWDTGASRIVAPNSYKDKLNLIDSIFFKIGNTNISYKGDLGFSDNYTSGYIAEKSGKDVFLIGWNFFEDKIVEISYCNNYIRILEDTNDLDDYTRIPYKIKHNKLRIDSLIVCVQNQEFCLNNVMIDTGFNEAFISEMGFFPGLDMTDSYSVKGKLGSNSVKIGGDILLADSIGIANLYVDSLNICLTKSRELRQGNWTVTNLLGNSFFEHFSVILDFKNHNLYLKPLTD